MVSMHKISRFIGLAGVSDDECENAQRWGHYFSFLLLGAVLWLALQWHLEYKGKLDSDTRQWANIFVWLFFVIETSVLTGLVNNKPKYLKENWLNLLIITVGLPLLIWEYGPLINLLRVLRLFLLIGLLIPTINMIFKFLSDNRLDTTIIAAVMVLVFAGTLIASIDPGINSIEDGIWWAWVTISTVGYGDLVPVSTTGRVFSAILIFLGMALFSAITANFAAFFMKHQVEEVQKEQELENQHIRRVLEDLEKMHHDEQDMILILKNIETRLDRFEQSQGQSNHQATQKKLA